jgi:AraC-like DNA-binding protein
MGMSERTLRRRLSEAGSSYKGMYDALRAAEAERLLLESDASAAQVGLAVGFADQTAFIRAFRRWKGSTPGAWRARRRAEREGQRS